MKRIDSLGNMPEIIAKAARGLTPVVEAIAKMTGRTGVEFDALPEVYEFTSVEALMRKAKELDADTHILMQLYKPKDREGNPLTGAGHLERAYVVALYTPTPETDVMTGEDNPTRHYKPQLFFAEAEPRMLEGWDRQYQDYKKAKGVEKAMKLELSLEEEELRQLRGRN